MTTLEDLLALHIRAYELPEPVREYKFCKTRRFRLDFAWIDQKLGVEVQGGTYIKGAHSSGVGLERDYEKLNLAQSEGWKVLMFSRKMIESGYAVEMIKECLKGDRL